MLGTSFLAERKRKVFAFRERIPEHVRRACGRAAARSLPDLTRASATGRLSQVQSKLTMSSLSARSGGQRRFAMEIGHRRAWGPRGLSLLLGLLVLGGCEAGQQSAPGSPVVAAAGAASATMKPEESRMWMIVGERRFAITLTDNETARALAALLPLTLDMSEHNGNEKYASLPQRLPTNATRPGTIRNGDLMLFGSDTFVVFYSTFNPSYSYTRIGRVDDPAGLAQALGRSGVRVEFSKD